MAEFFGQIFMEETHFSMEFNNTHIDISPKETLVGTDIPW